MDSTLTVTPETERLRKRIFANRDAVCALLRGCGASRIRIFGSVAQGTATKDSDIDLLVDQLNVKGLFGFYSVKSELEDILQSNVDLVEEGFIKPNRRQYIMQSRMMEI